MAMASDDSDTQMKWAFPLFLKTQKGGGGYGSRSIVPYFSSFLFLSE
jgi:pyruvate carboxylase